MENPMSWGPVRQAIAQAQREFYKSFAHCDGPEPLDVVASGIVRQLVGQNTVAADRAKDAEAATLEALQQSEEETSAGLCGRSRVSHIYEKLFDKGLVPQE